MVKIVNPLGDVKIGKQGEVVYQRKYGEQIRRMVAPKRAIASEAQIEHRQLYRDALDWRKQLSLANRRYLEGYCIANGVVDRYHIPLAWSRFALKLYLQKVDFALITKPVAGEEGEEGLFESYEEGSNTSRALQTGRWHAQTFTPQVAHTINKVELHMRRAGDAGTVGKVSIRATDENGRPTGGDLTYVNFNPNADIPTDMTWCTFNLPPHALSKDVKYAIVAMIAVGTTYNDVNWDSDHGAPAYTYGCDELSTNYGVTWTAQEDYDNYFREYGSLAGKEAVIGLIHVRHPALLTVVHKRGELTTNGYDTLSSLDDEYLTGQVGVDVEVGDIIEATTLPGIKYTYQVK